MFCPTCGNALSQQLKYCNRCGANLVTTDQAAIDALEKRLDSHLDGLFWLTVLGLAFIIGGMVLMKKFEFSDVLILAFLAVSSSAFLVNFAVNFREIQRLKRHREAAQLSGRVVSELSLPPAKIEPLISVTENTTRNLEEVPSPKDNLPAGADTVRNA